MGSTVLSLTKTIEPTREWVTEIEQALDTCHALAALLTEGFHESKWTDQEIGFCVKRRILVLPIRVGLDPYGFISRYQALSPPTGGTAQTRLTALSDGIFNTLITHDLTAQHMTDALVHRFENSKQFSEAKQTSQYLSKVPRWTAEQLTRISSAAEQNYENANAFGVPERIREIVTSHSK